MSDVSAEATWQCAQALEAIISDAVEGWLPLVLGSLVQSGLSSKFDKTGTETGPHRLKNLKNLD